MEGYQQGNTIKNQSLKDYSNRDLKNRFFVHQELNYSSFSGSDLRGADFTGSDLSGADFGNARTGIPPLSKLFLFLIAFIVSLTSGYVAMLAGATVQTMLKSPDTNVEIAGVVTTAIIVLLIVYYYLNGGRKAIFYIVLPIMGFSVLLAGASYFFGIGSGKGMLYLVLAVVLTFLMFVVGTVARVAAGSLSGILFFLIAAAGSVFGKSVGGDIGTVVLAISCAVISKKALRGAPGFALLKAVASYITSRFGTSFRNCKMANANFSDSKKIINADFSGADILFVHWGNVKKINCIMPEKEKAGEAE